MSSAGLTETAGWLKRRVAAPRARGGLAPVAAILLVAAFIVAADNGAFWARVLAATTQDEHRFGILVSMFGLLFGTLVVLLSLAVGRWTLKIVGAALLLVASVAGYFMSEYGVIIDPSMIRNIVETETHEAAPLLTSDLLVHVAAFGLLPALALLVTPLASRGLARELAGRAALASAAILALVGTFYVNYGPLAFFVRENHSVRLFLNPGYPLYAAGRFALREDDRPPPQRKPLEAALLARPADAKPTLFVLVVGETARADRFSLNGYARDTNAYTRERGVVNFPRVTSCGTSTADSVPCIFSGLGRRAFTHAAAAENESLFGTLERFGVGVFWIDNSTGCKHVCDPGHFDERATATVPELCDSTGCFDEVLLQGLDELVADRARDHFLVLHQRGSHGPAYHTDTPAWAKRFLPECDSANPRNCSLELIGNAYDNTILYTDYFLSRVIDFLSSHEEHFDVAMLYVSDHGESLGENGLYLHGFPYSMAPEEQIRVPMLFWASPSFYAANRVDPSCLRSRAEEGEFDHDWIYYTLLPVFRVAAPAYRPELDLLAGCRRGSASGY